MPDLTQHETRNASKSTTRLRGNSRLQDLTQVLEKLPSWVPIGSSIIVALVSLWSFAEKNFELFILTLAIILWLICLYFAAKRVESPVAIASGKPRKISRFQVLKRVGLFGVILIPLFLFIGGGIRISMLIDARRLENPCLPQNKPSAPRVESFQVRRIGQAPAPVTPRSTIQISAGESLDLEARVVGTGKMSCAWKATRGPILPNDECTTKYSFPIGAVQAIVTLTVKSECKESTTGYLIFVTK